MRKLPHELGTYLDEKLWKQSRVVTASPTLLLALAAQVCADSKPADPHIVNLFRDSVATPSGQSWCVDFIQAVIAYVEFTLGVESPLPATQGVLDLWHRAPEASKSTEGKYGRLILWQHGQTAQGHCGVILTAPMGIAGYNTVEGNTHAEGALEHDGDGVYLRYRPKGGTKTFKEVGFLNAFDA